MNSLLLEAAHAVMTSVQEAMPADALGQQSLRAYWHVFIAYALVLVFVLGWVFSIARRMGAVEARLKQGASAADAGPPQGT